MREIIGRWSTVFALHETPLDERSVLSVLASDRNRKSGRKDELSHPLSISLSSSRHPCPSFSLIQRESKVLPPTQDADIRDFEVKERATRFPT